MSTIEDQNHETMDWNMEQFDHYYQTIERSVKTEMIRIEKALLKHPQKLETELSVHECLIITS